MLYSTVLMETVLTRQHNHVLILLNVLKTYHTPEIKKSLHKALFHT